MNCIFCLLDCMGTCEEWESLTVEWEILTTEIIDGIYDDFLHELAGVLKEKRNEKKKCRNCGKIKSFNCFRKLKTSYVNFCLQCSNKYLNF